MKALLFLLGASLGFGQIALTAHTAIGSPNSATISTSAIDTSACTPHCMIHVCYAASTAAPPANPISDTIGGVASGNVWTQIKKINGQGADVNVREFAAFEANVGTNHVFTATGFAPSLAVMAFSGVASGPDGAPATGTSDSGVSPLNFGNLVPTNNDELLASCFGSWYTGNTGYTAGSPLTTIDAVNVTTNVNAGVADAYSVQTSATTRAMSWAWSGSGAEVVGIASPFFSTLAPAPLSFVTTTLPEGFNGTAYNFPLVISGGVTSYTCSVTSGTLPTGISLTNCVLIGTPTQTVSATPLTIHVVDSTSPTPQTVDSSGLTLTIAAAALSITTSTCASGTQYASYAGCTIVGTGGTAPLTYGWSTSSLYAALPPGLAMDTSTGAITSSLIGAMGTYGVGITLTDSLGTAVTKVISFAFVGSTSWMAGIFPSNNIFYTRMDAATSSLPVSTSPADQFTVYAASVIQPFFGNAATSNLPNGIPAIEVPYNQADVSVTTTLYQSYFTSAPVPAWIPIEDTTNYVGGDNHCLVYLEAGGSNPAQLYEMYQCLPLGGPWSVSSNALWANTGTNSMTPLCPAGNPCGTTDAAGLPLTPLLVNADEVIGSGTPTAPTGTVAHMIRATVHQPIPYYEWPATSGYNGPGSCYAGAGNTNPIPRSTLLSQSSPPLSCANNGQPAKGVILRVKAGTSTPACMSTSPQASIIFTALKNYGIIISDIGTNIGIIGTPDTRWVDSDLACLKQIYGSNFEPVNVSSLIVSTSSFQAGTGAGTLPQFTSGCPTNTATQGVPYTSSIAAAIGTTPITFSVSLNSLPSGLTLNGATGAITGTPLGGGQPIFEFQATNAAGNATNGPLGPCTITVTALSPTIPGAGMITSAGSIR